MMTWFTALGSLAFPFLVYLVWKTYTHRSRINALRKQGIPMPQEWSWLTGHLLILQKYVDRLPPGANVNLAMLELAREYDKTEIFLMDFWPVYPPMYMVFDPEAATQITTGCNLPKTDMHLKFMKPITGGPNLISMDGQEWKTWRSLFNPGFSQGAMMENVPHIVNSVEVFCERLREKAGGDLFYLDDMTRRLTMDLIIKVTLGANLNYQRSDNELATALDYITKWHSFWDPRILMHPFRPFIQNYYGKVMQNFIRKEIDQRFHKMKEERISGRAFGRSASARTVIELAIESYIQDNEHVLEENLQLDEHFAQYAVYQLRLFLFAGNDTTSATMIYVYHLLSQHPETLRALRKEHDDVFGKDASTVAQMLRQQPALLNKCPFTLAVIKETLRLYPPAGTMRSGRPGIAITDRHGNAYPMDYVCAAVLHPAVHFNPRVWPHPEKFIPQRFLVGPGHELYVNAAAYRPFEQGPRGCIGQTLVYNEIRVAMIMTARTFDIKLAYDEYDTIKRREMGLLGKIKLRAFGEPVKTVRGDRAYQMEKAGTPANGYPCRVSFRSEQITA